MTSFWVLIFMLILGIVSLKPCWCHMPSQQTSNGDQSTNSQVAPQLAGLKNTVNEFYEDVIRQLKIAEVRLQSIISEIDALMETHGSSSNDYVSSNKPQPSESIQANIESSGPQSGFQNLPIHSTSSSQTLYQHPQNPQLSSTTGNQIQTSNQNPYIPQKQSTFGSHLQAIHKHPHYFIQPSTFGNKLQYSVPQTQNLGQQSSLNFVRNKNQHIATYSNEPAANRYVSNPPQVSRAFSPSHPPLFPYYPPTNNLHGYYDAISQHMPFPQPMGGHEYFDTLKNSYLTDNLKSPAFVNKEEYPLLFFHFSQPSNGPLSVPPLQPFLPQSIHSPYLNKYAYN